MRAEKIPAKDLAPIVGDYWRLIDDSGKEDVVIVARAALPADVADAEAALDALVAISKGPTPEQVAREVAAAARVTALRDDQTRLDLLGRLRSATPAQIDNYIDAKVTNLAQARDMFKAVLKLIALDTRD